MGSDVFERCGPTSAGRPGGVQVGDVRESNGGEDGLPMQNKVTESAVGLDKVNENRVPSGSEQTVPSDGETLRGTA